jgi:NhaP-type Na+/H+ or K+/H+ antiporter
MAPFLSAGIQLLGIVAVSAAVLLTMLVLRNPFSPRWLKSEGVAQGAAFVLTACFFVGVGFASDALIAVKFHYLLVVALIAAVVILSTYGLWTLFAVGKRLKRADEGLSPFSRDRQPHLSVAHAA